MPLYLNIPTGQTDGRQTVTLRFLLDAAVIINGFQVGAVGEYNSREMKLGASRCISRIVSASDASLRFLQKDTRNRRGTATRYVPIEILSAASKLYEKSHLKRLAIGE